MKKKDNAVCFFCGKLVDAEDDFCHGCGEYVCSECGINCCLMGPHEVQEHLEECDE